MPELFRVQKGKSPCIKLAHVLIYCGPLYQIFAKRTAFFLLLSRPVASYSHSCKYGKLSLTVVFDLTIIRIFIPL